MLLETTRTIVIVLLAVAFVGMGSAHFLPQPSRGMVAMIPPRFRREGLLRPRNLVRFTGLCEVAGGLGLLVPQTRVAAGIALIVFLIAVFPANAFAARHPEKFGKAAIPFVPRLIAQVVLIAIIVFAIL